MLNDAAKSSCFNVRVTKKLNSEPVIEDGTKREGVCSINDERRMKETVRHMRKNLNT